MIKTGAPRATRSGSASPRSRQAAFKCPDAAGGAAAEWSAGAWGDWCRHAGAEEADRLQRLPSRGAGEESKPSGLYVC